MAKLYGTGLYGVGKYSALTAYSVPAVRGSFAETGQSIGMPLAGKIVLTYGAFTLTGFLAGLGQISWSVGNGAFSLAGQAASFLVSSIWTPEASADGSWVPQAITASIWTPQTQDSTSWIPK